MTPYDLRMKAKKYIEDAKLLLDSSPANAFYLAGYAVEFTLKARLCVTRKWPRMPRSLKECQNWNKRDGYDNKDRIFIHDLDELLSLSDSIRIKKSTFTKIDWERACTWNEQVRYEKDDSKSKEEASMYIDEVEKVVHELNMLDLLTILLDIEIRVSKKYGSFHCFALIKRIDGHWDILFSYISRTQDIFDKRHAETVDLLRTEIDSDLKSNITQNLNIGYDAPILSGLYALLNSFFGGLEHSFYSSLSDNITVGFPSFPPAYVITAANWDLAGLNKQWDELETQES